MKDRYIDSQKRLFLFIFLLLFSLVIAACSAADESDQEPTLDETLDLTQEVSASGEVVPVQWVTLSFSSIAEDVEILVSEGDTVIKGDPLVRNNDSRLEITLLQAQSALERAQFAYNQVLNAPSQAVLKSADAAYIKAKINLDQQETFSLSQDQIDIAQADYDAARANYIDVLNGSSEEEVAAAEYDLKAAELALEQADAAYDLEAPFNGTVVEIYVNAGESIGALQPVLVMADLSNLQVVTTDLSEVDVTRLSEGQKANIVFDAISDQTFSATIQKIANIATGVSSVYYEVTLSLDETPSNLRWGMTAFITFPLE